MAPVSTLEANVHVLASDLRLSTEAQSLGSGPKWTAASLISDWTISRSGLKACSGVSTLDDKHLASVLRRHGRENAFWQSSVGTAQVTAPATPAGEKLQFL